MELFTRVITEGFFIFWNDNNACDAYNLKIRIFNMNTVVEILNERIEGSKRCFSFNNIGSGEYEIELSGLKNGAPIETVSKKVKLESTMQKETELLEHLKSIDSHIYELYLDFLIFRQKFEVTEENAKEYHRFMQLASRF